ncbi:ADP-heptose:LPS heptosyltransferase [Flavobacterium enshiense DK69]|uniref:ADP-heptose:LPS heptosyltransferase n=1 Tax=Flavobacterium enshiense DK69 TaxID=1107311 RepID=V6S6X6_9FLAO|nr:glycosyltransferase family 9 protein [Flavobacterium enshiense]ESU22406.1 ADP-heptose:LPS heptosyltransferase [Flavobacterium enshiense DK69]KGO97408.1 ADP-heptose:LPS heptosyltransferase [Flavobacterium enshiense DK69]
MKKVLIIQNKRIGDVLISSVIANNFKAKYPDSEVHFMAYDFTHGVIENNPNIDKIISINDKELKKFSVLLKLIRQIQKEKYDIIFDPYSKTQSRIICKFSGAKQTIGHKSRKKFGNWGYYTNPVEISKEKTKICGKAIEDRIHLLNQAGDFEPIDYEPKIFLSEAEKKEDLLGKYSNKKVIVLGVLGSTPQKSMPYEYVAEMVDFIAKKYDVNILFNYAPHQKTEAMKIYEMCKNKENIIVDIYAQSIRDFVKLMSQCNLLVSNEGGTVHIAKALHKPTFTIFSPYVNKDHWASFEDGKFHHSVHLLEMKPDLFDSFTFEERKKIEKNPDELYKQLTPEMIIPELDKFLQHNL